jgi:ABC-2 type transport system permease protein
MTITRDRISTAHRAGMNPWRLEWLRMTRTPRALSLFGVYLAFGLLGPVLAKYMSDLVKHAQNGMTIIVPPPVPRDGIADYVDQVAQTGLVVVVVVAAGALTFDGRRGISTFLRTRTTSMWGLVAPRYLVTTGFALAACVLGTLAAWYETALLIGALPVGAMLAGLLCQAVYLAFVVAVVAWAASLVRGTLATVGAALGLLLVLPVIGILRVLHDWLPSTLVSAPVQLLAGDTLADYLPALAVASLATVVLLAAAVRRLRAREQ